MTQEPWNVDDIPAQLGRTVLVTGATSGLGLATATALAERGARVFLGCRNEVKGKVALDQVGEVASGDQPELLLMDLGERGSLAEAARNLAGRTAALDVLVNNAGVTTEPTLTSDGDEVHFGTNHLGPFALTAHLLPLLLKSPLPRVVTIASLGQWFGRPSWEQWHSGDKLPASLVGYCDSKLANIMFALELDRRAKAANSPLISVGAHPGMTHSNLAHDARGFTALVARVGSVVFQDMPTGVLSHLRATTDPTLRGGEYIGQDRLMGLRGAPTHARYRRLATNVAAREALWKLSEERCGVSFRLNG